MTLDIKPLLRTFLPQHLDLKTWDDVKAYADDLLARDISTLDAFKQWMLDENEFSMVLYESLEQRYRDMTCFTNNDAYREAFDTYQEKIDPELSKFADDWRKKLLASPFVETFDEPGFLVAMRGAKMDATLFRDANIPLMTEDTKLQSEYGKIMGEMTIELDGQTLTPQQAGDRLFLTDRDKREEAWRAIDKRRAQDADRLDEIFDKMVNIRHQIAQNAGEENYRDYKFKALNRFDYTPQDCFNFHKAVEEQIVPTANSVLQKRKANLGVESLRPWDLAVDIKGRPPLKGFDGVRNLTDKTIKVLHDTDPLFGETLDLIDKAGRLDLDSRPHKQPGGYMMGMAETRIPFIFANATQKVRDIATLIHEAGHGVHGILAYPLKKMMYRSSFSEVNELAAMTMELITMDAWHHYFPNEGDLRRAKQEHLEDIVTSASWIARVDAFQHDIYTQPNLTPAQRNHVWHDMHERFVPNVVDWSGLEATLPVSWHKQLHIFEVPFYYIEYGIAQLGALQLWRNFKQDKKQALAQYKAALALGGTKTIPEIYAAAGVKFDFSSNTLRDLMQFVQQELSALE